MTSTVDEEKLMDELDTGDETFMEDDGGHDGFTTGGDLVEKQHWEEAAQSTDDSDSGPKQPMWSC